ncbi:MAG: winged helix-turn-helix transcriptional regulator [Solirubrobacteraceae bacterium]
MRPEDHPAERTAHLVGRHWTALVLDHLQAEPLRHGELLERMCGISQKTLTERLRDLERHEAVRRVVLPGPVPGTLYSLTARGHELARLLGELAAWGESTLPCTPIAPPPSPDRPPAIAG